MIGDFYKSFGKEKDEQRELPQEVVNALNEELPANFEYIIDDSGNYRAVPKADMVLNERTKITTEVDFDSVPDLRDKLMTIPRDKWDEYLYRTQTALPIKSAQIGDENKQIPIELLSADPLHSDGAKFVDGVIHPYPFRKTKITFESSEGDAVQISFQQQAYDSVTEVKFTNVDFPALKVELYQYSPLVDENEEVTHTSQDQQLTVTYSVIPSKAGTVKDAVVALHVFRGLFNGTTKVAGKVISTDGEMSEVDPARIEDALNLWETVLKIEEKLEVSFDPAAEFPNEDVQFLTELQTCLLEGKEILWRHPFDHFHVGGFRPAQEGMLFEDFIGNGAISYEFLEGPIPATLLGAEFDLYSHTEMKDFVITNIEWDDENHEGAEVYISDVPDKQWCLTRLYLTKKQAEDFSKRIDAAKKGKKS